MALITLVRHGQASFAADDYDQLSPLGAQQAQALGELVQAREEQLDCVVHGTLKRHIQSLDAFTQGLGTQPQRVADAQWNEFDHRDVLQQFVALYPEFLEDVLSKEPKRLLPVFVKAVRYWQTHADASFYHENWAGFSARVQAAWETLAKLTAQHRKVWVFTSGGPISLSVMRALDCRAEQLIQLNQKVVNTSITRFALHQEQRQLLSFNEHGHLAGKYEHLLSYI
ncbi:hypothetical protein CWE15_02030 [Aliidiomarina taiwanensis]|uniref:Histidine phosphatase family protein n=1 Tax=Aliidiomarina taiwanensis TaxID=946228 RepID=A0A432X9I6_9GAMM|nr:histidine phosphatase family protein [Aliidiomarina taiwanensis]RUO43984.1 hypothetical protein CWE15_02030 [Aliidiomarina taiwanensis]